MIVTKASDLCVPCNVISHCRIQCSHCCLPGVKAHVSPFAEFSSYMGDLKYSSWLPISLTYIVHVPPSLSLLPSLTWRDRPPATHHCPDFGLLSRCWVHSMGIRSVCAFSPLGTQHRSEGSMWHNLLTVLRKQLSPLGREPFAFLIDQILGMQRNKYGSLPDLISGRMDSWP